MNKPTLISMVGLPRSGKSTFARKLSKKEGIPLICPDEIRLALGFRFNADLENLVWLITKMAIIALFGAGHEKVILDATNISKGSQTKWVDERWVNEYIIVDTPLEICLKRADEVLKPVIERMSKNIHYPQQDTGVYFYDSKGE